MDSLGDSCSFQLCSLNIHSLLSIIFLPFLLIQLIFPTSLLCLSHVSLISSHKPLCHKSHPFCRLIFSLTVMVTLRDLKPVSECPIYQPTNQPTWQCEMALMALIQPSYPDSFLQYIVLLIKNGSCSSLAHRYQISWKWENEHYCLIHTPRIDFHNAVLLWFAGTL